MTKQKRIMISAGEASGDKHAAELIKTLHSNRPGQYQFNGMGSKQMAAAACELLVDSADIAVVGIVEVLAHWNQIQDALKTLKNEISNKPPDLLILIDYPEFNLKLAKFAKDRGVTVLFYVSPQIWAWRPKRIKKIGDAINMMAVIFPFEVPIYEKENIPVRYVGHPLLDVTKPKLDKPSAYRLFGLDSTKKTLGLFPGSRKSEIHKILPLILKCAERINKEHDKLQFILPIASTLDRNLITQYTQASKLDIQLVDDHYYDVINICDSIITASGTATLEIGLIGTPMVIVYRVSALTYFIMSRLIKIDHIGLANIVAEKRVVPELIQNNATEKAIAAEVSQHLSSTEYNQSIRANLSQIKENLSKTQAKTSLSELVTELTD